MSASTPEVSVVVTTRNRADLLTELLTGLRAQTLPHDRFELVVVNDASTDRTAEVLSQELRRDELTMSVVTRTESGGAAIGREQGWRQAQAPLIAFTDDDCLPEPDWLERSLEVCRAHPGAIVQGRTSPRPDQLSRTGPFTRTMDVQSLSAHFPTTNIFYPRVVLTAIDGFDVETYAGTVGGEDTDLAWRAIESGTEAFLAPDSHVYHAVNYLGPLGKLRVAGRPSATLPFARFPQSREGFVHGIFRKPVHFYLAVAILGLLAPRGWRALGIPLTLPYLHALYARGKIEGGGLRLAPYFLSHDLVEMQATVRGAIKGGRLLI
ncbi:MAG: glycosyltransferase family 2 protein [Actinomycetota bacterium]|nr:glycosyltransferase family 2 protein [Actinomycetota bacterium]